MEVRVNIFMSWLQGDQFWRLDENMVMEPGYPKPLAAEFPGLSGNINAALAVPATRTRPETVFFFKDGRQQGNVLVIRSQFHLILDTDSVCYSHLKRSSVMSLKWTIRSHWKERDMQCISVTLSFPYSSSRRHHAEVHLPVRQHSTLQQLTQRLHSEPFGSPGWWVLWAWCSKLTRLIHQRIVIIIFSALVSYLQKLLIWHRTWWI